MSRLAQLRDRFRRDDVSLQLDDIQALILRSRPEPYVGVHAILRVTDAAGGRDLVARLAQHVPSAHDWSEDLAAWTGVAFSHAGLEALGVPQSSLATFPSAFRQGMAARAQDLRDTGINAPEHWDAPLAPGNLHIALTIYAQDQPALDEALATAMGELGRSEGVELLGTHQFGADEDAKNPFGFRDSISQPTVAGSGAPPLPGEERAVAPGEFILGEKAESGSPLAHPEPADLGVNGSFVVLRKYYSRVGAFNDFIAGQANTDDERHMLAAKMFGRWRSGAPLVLSPDHEDEELGGDPQRNNAFTFADDPRGFMCPHSSHMRRLNPRDSPLTIMTDVNIHRIIRRSSTFGAKWSPEITASDDAQEDRGLYFIFISARAFDTIEFLQEEWINNGNFVDLGVERDPVVGLHEDGDSGTFTLPDEPTRRRVHGVTTFNRMAGGEYMFMPSLTALRWIGSGGWGGGR